MGAFGFGGPDRAAIPGPQQDPGHRPPASRGPGKVLDTKIYDEIEKVTMTEGAFSHGGAQKRGGRTARRPARSAISSPVGALVAAIRDRPARKKMPASRSS